MTCYVLDTDHLSLYERAHPQVCDRILQVRRQSLDLLATTVVSVEEQYAGRLAQIRKAATPQALVNAYGKLKLTFILFSELDILEYTLDADRYFRSFRQAGIRIGTQDLRIAAITLAHNGILLTRNLRDFEKVPRLSVQDWSI
ncbi:MAG: Ribonuclease VapC2 [Chroococcidiopsis sp. SAG 2025]|uniref:type II toxin-antitoxin system VapC family toxin n=1 Tax=Chroococcidiopsis sp. SAG 2025 TaxID=171389 RepID=UPI002937257C|nr:type II toxin-antitoxin system VapC family toxin [Chroococcidiopsis sp. SAG 2025]MDV2997049.1 Ribonuclease VapC2 [Chroococcidiopsis sp. SAG 2025]